MGRVYWCQMWMDIVPEELEVRVDSNKFVKLNSLWNRRQTTKFNGASYISQMGALTSLSERGQKECEKVIDYYMGNAEIIKEGVEGLGLKAYGGENAPYVWVKTSMHSWDFFDKLLEEAHVVSTPGVGFGPSGEGYIRLSAFGHRENVQEAIESIQKNLK